MHDLTTEQASQYLKESHGLKKGPTTLARMRVMGGGPGYYRDGRSPRYTIETLDAWAAGIKGRVFVNTAAEKAGAA